MKSVKIYESVQGLVFHGDACSRIPSVWSAATVGPQGANAFSFSCCCCCFCFSRCRQVPCILLWSLALCPLNLHHLDPQGNPSPLYPSFFWRVFYSMFYSQTLVDPLLVSGFHLIIPAFWSFWPDTPSALSNPCRILQLKPFLVEGQTCQTHSHAKIGNNNDPGTAIQDLKKTLVSTCVHMQNCSV